MSDNTQSQRIVATAHPLAPDGLLLAEMFRGLPGEAKVYVGPAA